MSTAVTWIGSPHRHKGRQGFRPEAVVIHIIEGTLAAADNWFQAPESMVSAHYGVGRTGEIHQYVGEADTAFHAGRVWKSTWTSLKPRVNPNLYTIGIEHEGKGSSEWPEAMYTSSARLIADVCTRWSIPIDRAHVIGHREIYGRKTCPNDVVDLPRLIAMARAAAVAPDRYNFIPQAGSVRTRTGLNVRRGAPTTAAPALRAAPAGVKLDYVGWTSNGMSVNGNPHWYRDEDGNYFWAGATTRPTPGIGD
jgi:N-acetylmuramoyl-L-alanine amidase